MFGNKPSLSEISMSFQIIVLFILGLTSGVMASFSINNLGFTDQGVMKPIEQIDSIILIFRFLP